MDEQIRQTLTKAFPFASHKWRVLNTSKKNDKATWYVYVDARDVAERLDSTGLDWSDEYEVITMTDKLCVVQCRLTIGSSTRSDVGSDSKNSIDSEGNYIKGAYSDALKRAAVKFGVGRYLYSMTSYYLPIDEFKRFTSESLTKIKAHLSKELKAFGATGNVEDLRSEDEEVELPPKQAVPPKPATRLATVTSNPTSDGDADRINRKFHAELTSTFGGLDMTAAKDWAIRKWTQKHTPEDVRDSATKLTPEEMEAIADGLKEFRTIMRNTFVNETRKEAATNLQGDPVPDLASIEDVAF